MPKYFSQPRFLVLAVLLSLAAHVCALSAIVGWGPYRFALPPSPDEFIVAELKQLPPETKPQPPVVENSALQLPLKEVSHLKTATLINPEFEEPAELLKTEQKPIRQNDAEPPPEQIAAPELPLERILPLQTTPVKQFTLPPPIRHISQFIKTKSEKLSYKVSLLGIPAGWTELEAHNERGELRITSHTESTGALSFFYPVDTTTQTRMFSGRYIMTTMKQRQGDKVSDIGFTINLGEKSVFWADRLHKRSSHEIIPNSEVLDIFSALYFLRNQQLTVGETIRLHIYDSSRYVNVPVRIVKRETIHLPGLRVAETLLIKPELTTEGFFRRTGEILIWLTDDEYHVPVRMETEIALGRITAELVSAETEPQNSATGETK